MQFTLLFLIIWIFISPEISYPKNPDSLKVITESKFEPLPIFYYDSNDGFGYGAKAFFLNFLNRNESFDMLLVRSTKGFQKYNLVFSVPDFELRQGTVYSLALDLELDFKKWISFKFYGVGNATKYENEELYTRVRPTIALTLSRGFSKTFVGQFGLKYQSTTNSDFEEDGLLHTYRDLSVSRTYYYSLFLVARYDTRNSFIHPSDGVVVQGETEYANGNVTFNRWAMWLQHYTTFLNSTFILASRFGIQSVYGDNLPIQVLLPIGGDDTIRGFPQDRFLDKTSAVINVELRFPFYWRFGGTIGLDAGKVWQSINKMNFTDWAYNPTFGVRFYFDTFVVRADLGISKETMGIYLNFGHIF
jgi:outer membrane protein assembly factor BamA